MPLRGGPADKLGGRFEDRWAAACAFRVLRGEASWIHLESYDPDEEGFEFTLAVGDTSEHHQVKRQRSEHGAWSLYALASAGVLSAFRDKLDDPAAYCVFASANAAQALEDLATEARKTESWEQFERYVLRVGHRNTSFRQLREYWGDASERWAFKAVKRLRTENLSERQLQYQLRLQAELLLEGPIDTAAAVLVDTLRERVGEKVGAALLWADMERAGFKPNAWRHSGELSRRVKKANDRFRESRQTWLIGRQLIARPEATQISEGLADSRVVLVEGDAGVGKSDVLLQYVDQLRERNVSHLVFRLDRQTAQASPDALGEELELPASPPATLAALANGEPCVLVIDQLDAVSGTSGRSSAYLENVDNMLRAAAACPGMSVVLACRRFDLRNDARLRRVLGDDQARRRVSVGALSHNQVDEALRRIGVDRARVDPRLSELLRVPLHLYLLEAIGEVGECELARLRSTRDLYRQFWQSRQRDVSNALGREPRWTEVLDALCDYMSENAVLHAPRELVDELQSDVDAMLSAAVLSEDGGRLSFFHETFFDYVFARRFFGRNRTLRELLEKDQLLFRRAQVRQILAYQREGDLGAYAQSLRYLLLDGGIRFHLIDLVLSWLATVDDPVEVEWEILSRLLGSSRAALTRRSWETLRGPGWFGFLDQRGLVERWLEDPDRADAALAIIFAGETHAPERAAELLRAHRSRSEQAANDVVDLMRRHRLAESREAFDLFIELLDEDDAALGRSDFFYLGADLPAVHPDWACEIVGAYLRNRLRAADAQGTANPFDLRQPTIPRTLHLNEFTSGGAKAAPDAYLRHVWPQMLEIIERTARPPYDDTQLSPDAVWDHPHIDAGGADVDDALLEGAEIALRELAALHPDRFLAFVEENCRDADYETVCFLIAEGFRGNCPGLADQAVKFLLADRRRLSIGRSAHSEWQTRLLLRDCAPHCSEDMFRRLEAAVLDYYTSWEKSRDGHRQIGLAQFTLLEALDQTRLSPGGWRRLREWRRKFGPEPPEPFGVQGGVVGSPIPAEATRKMRDEHWLRAFRRYSTDESDRREFLKGGAFQLSNELQARATEQPDRFAALAPRMPDDTNIHYFDALLRGIGASADDLGVEPVRTLVSRCHDLPGRPAGRWIAHPLCKLQAEPLPDDLLEIAAWYALEDPDPDPAADADPQHRDEDDPVERLDSRGLDSVRGSMAYELAVHVHRHLDNAERLRGTIEALGEDRSPAVRTMAIRCLTALMRWEADRAVELFVRLAAHADDRVLGTRDAYDFLRYAGPRHYPRLEAILRRMLESANEQVRTVGAVQVGLVALDGHGAQELAESCLKGDKALRLGIARVNAANVRAARHRDRCLAALKRHFEDSECEVRKAAVHAFIELAEVNFERGGELVEQYLDSPYFGDESSEMLLHALENAEAPPPAITLRVCQAFLDVVDVADVSGCRGSLGIDVSELGARAYADADDHAGRERALDVIDSAIERGAYGATRALRDHDRP